MRKTFFSRNPFSWVLLSAILILLVAIAATGGGVTLARFSPFRNSRPSEPQTVVVADKPPVPTVVAESTSTPYAAFVEHFTAANGDVALQLIGSQAAQMPFADEMVRFDLNGETVNLYTYDSTSAREQISEQINADGGSYAEIDKDGNYNATYFDLTDYPHFWAWEQYLVEYIGHDGTTIDMLTNAFGSQFAGGAFYDSTLEMLTAQEWVFVNWGTPNHITAAIPLITRVRFKDGHMSGTTGVNGFGAPFILDENEPAVNFRLSLDEFVMTEAVSEDPAVTEQERIFVQALREAHHIAVGPDVMTITYGDGFFLGFAPAVNDNETGNGVSRNNGVITTPDCVELGPLFDQITASLTNPNTLTDPSWAASVQGVMWMDFGFGCWRCEWQTLTPERVLPSIVPLFAQSSRFTVQLLPNEASATLDGQNPYQMLGSEVDVTGVLHVDGLGETQTEEALLWFTLWENQPVWRAMLVAPEGFQ